ncbi:related to putative N2,N2-dimethylguanosine tRNA methyltransferase [Ramularia collo-cygni]|uniref:Protein-lysine N-methyltransferase EFM6 n=1 Tax=Ramularia collo-cygni TaxID=112498 RepID=A0A2D3VFN2_9PEZI|nr:related to putative N2,N2-dimethylguanosine tRNA methyltransferase [Ramularia collo-cygni]CZT24715.1 related to putative N2,N2-dimethylguanosine tRNA methyltransferase [Ramularia collo-cygni]
MAESEQDTFTVDEDLVQSPTLSTPSTSAHDFDGLIETKLILHQDLKSGNGGRVWQAGEILTKWLLRTKRETLRKASIVELGSGVGFCGLAIAVGCQPENAIYITDQQTMIPLMQRNIDLNNLGDKVKACVYNWGEQPDSELPSPPDVVLAADCVYFEPAFPLLQQTLRDLIGPSTVCYFCFKRRRRADMHFLKAIKKQFQVEDVKDDPDQPSYARENIYLFTIRRKPER